MFTLETELKNTQTKNYPLFSTQRISKRNIERLKKYAVYGASLDDCITVVLDTIELKGYETPKDQRSF